jgi:hypothetical protein
MEVFVNRAGQRVFINSPYIQDAELKRNTVLYDPNGYNLGCGLYDRTRPACERWVDHFKQQEIKYHTPPTAVYDTDGRKMASNFMRYQG